MENVIELLKEYGFEEAGTTRINSFRTTNIGYGGSIITLGGRLRYTKGNWIVTVGKRTTCLSLKPDNPESVRGQGRMAGKDIMTYRDWKQVNIPTKDIDNIKNYMDAEVGK